MLQHLLVAMPAQADGVECEKGAAICGTSDLPATDTLVLPCGFIAAASLLFEFEVRKGFMMDILKYLKIVLPHREKMWKLVPVALQLHNEFEQSGGGVTVIEIYCAV